MLLLRLLLKRSSSVRLSSPSVVNSSSVLPSTMLSTSLLPLTKFVFVVKPRLKVTTMFLPKKSLSSLFVFVVSTTLPLSPVRFFNCSVFCKLTTVSSSVLTRLPLRCSN